MMDLTINKLRDDLYSKVGRPVNEQVVRALLESMSIKDQHAQEQYGVQDLSALANLLFLELTNEAYLSKRPDPITIDPEFLSDGYLSKDFLKLQLKYFSKYYPLGLFHGLPVFLQIFTIVVFGYSMWTWVGFNQLQSTAVVLGVIFGLIGTGGFVQVIGRQVSHYWLNRDFEMARKSTITVFRDAFIFMGTLSLFSILINVLSSFYPFKFLLLVYMYSFSIGLLLLLSAVYHPIKERWMITLAFVIGASFSLWLKLFTDIHVYFTHWAGIWTSNLLLGAYLIYYLNSKCREIKIYNRTTTKNVTMVYRNYRYFFYGLSFFVFIFIDRLMAWSTSDNGFLPYVIYYEKNYEIGMDIAIVIFFLVVGVLEYSVSAFSTISNILQRQTPYDAPKTLNDRALKMYRGHVTLLLIVSGIMGFFIYWIVWVQTGYERAFEESLNSISVRVSLIGGLGYILVAWGMLNSLYLFTLNKPGKPLSAITTAIVVNVIVGWLASRMISYEYSVVGFLSGSFIYMWITRKYALRFFKQLDYYYYAAY